MGAKLGLEEKCNRLSKEIMMYKSKVDTLEETGKILREKS
jgi:hypothetical protein